MSKTHTAKLADRYEIRGRAFLRVRNGAGPTIEVRVSDGQRADAARVYGGGPVAYQYRGGRAFFVYF